MTNVIRFVEIQSRFKMHFQVPMEKFYIPMQHAKILSELVCENTDIVLITP